MNRILVFSGFFCVLLSVSVAQQSTPPAFTSAVPVPKGAIGGSILRASSNEPIRRALVTLSPVTQGQGFQNRGAAGTPNGGGQRGNPAKSIVTGEDGLFLFPDLDPGQYRIRVERDGYIPQEFGQRSWNGTGTPITVASAQKISGLTVQLLPAGTIAGRIRDEFGELLAGVQVQAMMYTYRDGGRVLTASRQAQSNDMGEYRLYWLIPGDYFVSATPGPDQLRVTTGGQRGPAGPAGPAGRGGQRGGATLLNPTSESFAPTYYPGTIEPESAVAVKLTPQIEIGGIDFTLQTVSTVKVSGRITSPEPIPAAADPLQGGRGQRGGGRGNAGGGAPGQRQQPGFPLLPGGGVQVLLSRIGPTASAGGRGGPGGGRGGGGRGGPGAELGEQAAARVNPDGTFEIQNVIPGSYNITAIQQAESRTLSARARVETGPGGTENVRLDLRYAFTVPGQIQLQGTAPGSFQLNQVRIAVNPVENLPFGNTMTEVDSEGKFALPGVGLMAYRINVAGLPNGAYVASAQYGSVDPLNDMLQVNDEGTKLVLQLAFTPGNLSGIATDKAGKPFQGATCILIPARRNRLDLFRTATSDQDGRFALANITPGEYKILALEDIPTGAHMDEAFLKNYEDRAKTIVIDKGESEVADIQVIQAGE